MREAWKALTVGAVLAAVPSQAALGQDLADYDYENLSFRGIGLEAGVAFPSRVETTPTINVRFDLGYLGPGFRLAPTLSYWRSDFKAEEVAELEDRLADLIVDTDPGATPSVDLGLLRWSDLVVTLDGQYVWETSPEMEVFLGTGFSAHLMNGSGAAIKDTFVEDLLDRVTLGVNAHLGAALVASPEFRLMGQLRYEVLDDLAYPEFRFGGVYFFNAGPVQ
ncbi:MAG: hypothetical protein OEO23_14160 [Gemmatimonadota bacterium]|nr:hypothetical protein [Gemmatimonadota bacterium]